MAKNALLAIMVISPLAVSSCTHIDPSRAAPFHRVQSMPEITQMKNAPPMVKKAMMDGCSTARKKRSLPGYYRAMSSISIDPQLAYDPDYRANWSRGYILCVLNAGYQANSKPFKTKNLLGSPIGETLGPLQ